MFRFSVPLLSVTVAVEAQVTAPLSSRVPLTACTVIPIGRGIPLVVNIWVSPWPKKLKLLVPVTVVTEVKVTSP